MPSNICKKCGKENEPDFKFCAFCGEKLSYLLCIECGEEYNKDYDYCGKCGGKLVDIDSYKNSDILYFSFQKEYTARGIQTSNGFILFKGAKLREEIVESARDHIINLRKKHANKIKNFVTTEDILFRSSSSAASFVSGSNLSGPKYWKSKGKTTNRKPSKPKTTKNPKYNDQVFYLKSGEFYGKGKYDGEIFTLFKGAKLNPSIASYSEKGVKKMRNENKNKIRNLITIDSIVFTSPSAAARFITGREMNGRDEWKNINGESINDIGFN